MLYKILISLTLCCVSYCLKAAVLLRFPFAGSTVELLDSADAAAATAVPDEYTRALSPFDLQVRLQRAAGGTEKDYLALAASQARTWSAAEQEQLKTSFEEIGSFLKENNIRLKLPEKIRLIKTAGGEEFGAEGYTRENRIMLCPGPGQPLSTHLLAHELFHVYSRFNEAKRDKLYALFGFRKCNRIHSASAMEGRMITNPDCPFTEHYITIDVDGKPVDAVLQLYSKHSYHDGFSMAEDIDVALLRVTGVGVAKVPELKDGKGQLLPVASVPDFFRQISTNTSYILHPEEITAEHFAMWVIGATVPQPVYFTRLKEALSQ